MTLEEVRVKSLEYFNSLGHGDREAELLSVAYTARIALRKLKQFEQADYFGAVIRRYANLTLADQDIIKAYEGMRT